MIIVAPLTPTFCFYRSAFISGHCWIIPRMIGRNKVHIFAWSEIHWHPFPGSAAQELSWSWRLDGSLLHMVVQSCSNEDRLTPSSSRVRKHGQQMCTHTGFDYQSFSHVSHGINRNISEYTQSEQLWRFSKFNFIPVSSAASKSQCSQKIVHVGLKFWGHHASFIWKNKRTRGSATSDNEPAHAAIRRWNGRQTTK